MAPASPPTAIADLRRTLERMESHGAPRPWWAAGAECSVRTASFT